MHLSRYSQVLQRLGMEVRGLGRDRLWLLRCHSLLGQKPGNP
ncbi:MAG: hypothetical protein JWP35_3236 [Caulobacter sp.]|nr:hypothetical protein [Caulobacter sp.]